MPFKIVFIFHNNFTAFSWSPAIQALSAYVKKHCGSGVGLIHINDKHGFSSKTEAIIRRIKKDKPGLIAFTSTSFGYSEVNRLAGVLKKFFPKTPIILGGVHATIRPQDLEKSNFDAFCIGEGEEPLAMLIRKLKNKQDYHDTPSFYFKKGGKIVKNRLHPYEKNLNNLPAYDWDIFDTAKLLKLRNGWISLSVSRGCPFNCNFCINHNMKRILGAAGYVRQKSAGLAIKELKDLIGRFDIKVFNFDDDILIFNKKWTRDFLSSYRKEIYQKYGIKFKVEARVDMIDENIAKMLKEAGCQEIQFGVETGSPRLRNLVLNKHTSDVQIIRAFDICHKYDINTLAFIMLGIPGETEQTLMDTVRLLARIKPYLIRPSFIFPIYGTVFYQYCKKRNFLKKGLDKYKTYLWTEGVPLLLKGLNEDMLIKHLIFMPWYINVQLGLKNYGAMISAFKDKSLVLKDKRIFNKILELDGKQSMGLSYKHVPHYSYFSEELSYLRYCGGKIT